MLQHAATRCNTLQTLQQTATRCNTLQHAATRCNTLQHTAAYPRPAVIMTATHCNTLQHTATHCNAPNHTATHYNVPQKILPCTFLQCIVRILESIQVSSLHPVCIHHRFACCEIRWAPLQLYLVFTILWSVGQFLWVRNFSHVGEACHTYEWGISHMRMGYVSESEASLKCQWDFPHIWESYGVALRLVGSIKL